MTTYPKICVVNYYSQVFKAWNICLIRNHSDFKYLLVFFFFRPTPTIDLHNLLKPPGFFHPNSRLTTRGPRILDDLIRTHFLARFVLFHFSNFVYVRARMCLSINLTEEGWLRVAAEYISPLSTLHCSVWCWFWLEVSPLECVQDFLIKLDMKPCIHLVEISIFSPNHFIIRLTKIMNHLLELLQISTFKVIFLC